MTPPIAQSPSHSFLIHAWTRGQFQVFTISHLIGLAKTIGLRHGNEILARYADANFPRVRKCASAPQATMIATPYKEYDTRCKEWFVKNVYILGSSNL